MRVFRSHPQQGFSAVANLWSAYARKIKPKTGTEYSDAFSLEFARSLPKPLQPLFGWFCQFLDHLDGVDLFGNLGQNSRVIPRPCSDLQHPIAWRQFQQFCHVGQDVRLRDGLPIADWQLMIIVGPALLGLA